MIYSVHNRLGFIHIPRTGGTAIKDALRDCLTNPAELTGDHKHATAYWAREYLLGQELFDEMIWFAVYRDPIDLLLSAKAAAGDTRSFQDYFYLDWCACPWKLSHGGFLTTYCSDPESPTLYPNICVASFYNLAAELQKIGWQLRLQIPAIQSKSVRAIKRLSQSDEATVKSYCWQDYASRSLIGKSVRSLLPLLEGLDGQA